MKKIRRIRMTTRTSKLVVVQNKTVSPEAASTAAADGRSHAEVCPTCGQPLLSLQPPPAVEQKPLLPPPAAAAKTAVACLNEHEADET